MSDLLLLGRAQMQRIEPFFPRWGSKAGPFYTSTCEAQGNFTWAIKGRFPPSQSLTSLPRMSASETPAGSLE
jgi:hypothetical protein